VSIDTLEMFHEHQGQTLRIHEQYLIQQTSQMHSGSSSGKSNQSFTETKTCYDSTEDPGNSPTAFTNIFNTRN